MNLAAIAVGQNLYLKGKFFYVPLQANTTTLYSLALEREFENLWSIELGTAISIFDETRNDGTYNKYTFVNLEVRKGVQIDEKSITFINVYTGFAKLINELNTEDPRNQRYAANGLASGLGIGTKIFFSQKFGAELSIGPRYFFSFEDNSETVKRLKHGNLSLRIGFNFFWRLKTN
jgi:hypothetical protein